MMYINSSRTRNTLLSFSLSEFLTRFRELAYLARGGMGDVYTAWDCVQREKIAIKFLSREFMRHEADVQRFRREFVVASEVQHANIVRVFDFGDREGAYFFTMEFVEGQNLRAIFTPERELSLRDLAAPDRTREILRITIGILKALAHLHIRRIVHRDLKPENVMLCEHDGEPKLLDFGLIKIPDLLATLETVHAGTPRYMSPESILGKPVDGRADLYSLGVMLYEAFTGTLPFPDTDFYSILTFKTGDQNPDIRTMNTHLGSHLALWINRLLAHHRSQRFAGVNETLAALWQAVRRDLPAGQITRLEETCTDSLMMIRSIQIFESEFVGRDLEHAMIRERVENAEKKSQCANLLVAGCRGSGRSRLLEEVARGLTMKRFQILWLRCRPGQKMGFADLDALAVQVMDLLSRRHGGPMPDITGLPAQVARDRLPSLSSHPRFSQLPLTPELDQDQQKNALFTFLDSLLDFICAHSPTTLMVDDLQWMDSASREYLPHYFRSPETRFPEPPPMHNGRLLFLACRLEELEADENLQQFFRLMQDSPDTTRLDLTPLSRTEIGTLVQSSLGTVVVSPALGATIYHRSGGNPFHAYELTRNLVDTGVLRITADGWFAGDVRLDDSISESAMESILQDQAIPDSVQHVVHERLQAFAPEIRKLLDICAVAGNMITTELLSKVSLLPEDQVLVGVDTLIRYGVLYEKPGEISVFGFLQNLAREVIYSNIDPSSRKNLHARVLDYLLETADVRVPAAIQFEHACQTQDWPMAHILGVKAVEETIKAFDYDRARQLVNTTLDVRRRHHLAPLRIPVERYQAWLEKDNGNLEQAAHLYRSVVHQIEDMEERTLIRNELSNVLYGLGSNDDAMLNLEEGLAELRSMEPCREVLVARLLASLANFKRRSGDLDEADRLTHQAMNLATSEKDPSLERFIHSLFGLIRLASSDLNGAEQEFRRSLHLAGQSIRASDLLESRNLICAVAYFKGELRTALAEYELLAQEAEKYFFTWGREQALQNIANILIEIGEFDRAVEVLGECLRLARRRCNVENEIHALFTLARIANERSEHTRAKRFLAEAETLAVAHNLDNSLAYVLVSRGVSLTEQERYEEAIKIFADARSCFETVQDEDGILGLNLWEAEIRHRMNDLVGAVNYLEQARDAAVSHDQTRRLNYAYVSGQIQVKSGNPGQALKILNPALEIARKQERRPFQAELERVLARAHLAIGDHSVARQHIRNAITIFQEFELPAALARCFTLAGEIYAGGEVL